MSEPLRVGDILYGYCGGAFGRDRYGEKRVEAIGADWVVAREDGKDPVFAQCRPSELEQYREPPEDEC